jgi:DNA-binding response OmpR family regulator
MKAGAIDYLVKPFQDEELLDAVKSGIECDRALRLQKQTLDELTDPARIAFASRKRDDGVAFSRTGTQADCRPIGSLHAHGSRSQ